MLMSTLYIQEQIGNTLNFMISTISSEYLLIMSFVDVLYGLSLKRKKRELGRMCGHIGYKQEADQKLRGSRFVLSASMVLYCGN